MVFIGGQMIRCMGVMSDGGNCIALPGGGTRPETGDGKRIAMAQ